MATTLKKVPALVAEHSAFKGNSIYAKVVGEFYAVFSYGEHFPIAIRRRTNDAPWLVNEDKYSRTTSRHQSTVLGGILKSGRGHIKCSTQNLKNLLAGGVRAVCPTPSS
jgi:hypothetical protein